MTIDEFKQEAGCLHKKDLSKSGFVREIFMPTPSQVGNNYSQCEIEVVCSGFSVADTAYYRTEAGRNIYAEQAVAQGRIVIFIGGFAVDEADITFEKEYGENIYHNSADAAQEQIRIAVHQLFEIDGMLRKQFGKGLNKSGGHIECHRLVVHSYAATSVPLALFEMGDPVKDSKALHAVFQKGIAVSRRVLAKKRADKESVSEGDRCVVFSYIQSTAPYNSLRRALETFGVTLMGVLLASFIVLYTVTLVFRIPVDILIATINLFSKNHNVVIRNPINLYLPNPFGYSPTHMGSEEYGKFRHSAGYLLSLGRAFLPSLRVKTFAVHKDDSLSRKIYLIVMNIWGIIVRPLIPLVFIKPEIRVVSPEASIKKRDRNGYGSLYDSRDIDSRTGLMKRVSILSVKSLIEQGFQNLIKIARKRYQSELRDIIDLDYIFTGVHDRLLRWELQMEDQISYETLVALQVFFDTYNEEKNERLHLRLVRTSKGYRVIKGRTTLRPVGQDWIKPKIPPINAVSVHSLHVPFWSENPNDSDEITLMDETQMEKLFRDIRDSTRSGLRTARELIGRNTIRNIPWYLSKAGTFEVLLNKVRQGKFEDWLIRNLLVPTMIHCLTRTDVSYNQSIRNEIASIQVQLGIADSMSGGSLLGNPISRTLEENALIDRLVNAAQRRFRILLPSGHNPFYDVPEELQRSGNALFYAPAIQSLLSAA